MILDIKDKLILIGAILAYLSVCLFYAIRAGAVDMTASVSEKPTNCQTTCMAKCENGF